ncbi:two-component system, sensor histidine kinase YesM [Paenibacillus sp. UNCCL117]|uniref:cache domain-containing sensor histidine kinase n=1 Tax=unclassified Paenibacillus TaxID=185978 RepID=UPI00087FB7F6|nr:MULTISPECIES: sensor histidine kinase [unclassified Paenibacillus]SDE19553.1 two-component system, sensor histidine kinase YesM [Paenibacillus sp. cl123]SFW61984.1 two-component system, sensor histidine kinase YesM [Paenibacillus sp. UNCCL117]
MFFSLRSRLMAAFSILMIIPFAAMVYMLSEKSAQIIQASIESSASQTIDQFASHVNTLLTQVEDIGNQMMGSRATQEWAAILLGGESSTQERLLAKQRVRESFSSYAVNNSNGISLSAFTGEGGGIWTQDRTYLSSDWYKEYSRGGRRWTTAHKDGDQADDLLRSRYVNSLIVPLVHLQSFRNVGIVKINYPASLLRGAIDKIRFGETGRVYLMTREGESVLRQEAAIDSGLLSDGLTMAVNDYAGQTGGVFPVEHRGQTYTVFFRKLAGPDWIVIGAVPQAELYAKIKHTRQTFILISLLLLAVALLVAYRLSYSVTRPLSRMAGAMKHIKRGEFGPALALMKGQQAGSSEVAYVAGVFEQMTDRLKYLIETEYETNLRRKNAEYKALLLQINPHFYNNTLEIISGLAATKREELVMDTTEALGKMMRYSLNLNSDLVRVKEELDYIRDYLFILQLRHGERLSLTVHEDDQAREYMMTKFILQPLVENAVKYSLEKDGIAKVSIRASVRHDRLLLAVKDNGTGMPPNLTRELLAEGETDEFIQILNSGGDSIGLRNVLSRCRLKYGSEFGLRIQSTPGLGTEIVLLLPLIRG